MQQPYYTTLFIPVDIGKNVNWFAGYAGYELDPVIEPTEVHTDRRGLARLTTAVDALLNCGAYERVVLGLEPTGIYHENWARALAEHYAPHREGQRRPPLDFCFLNPLLSKRRRKDLTRGRHRKTDPIDLKAIALCLRDGLGQPAFIPGQAELRFQLWGRAYRQTYQEQRRLEVRLLADLDRLWPGAVVNLNRFKKAHPHMEPPQPIVATQALQRQTLRALLQHCPNPYDLRALEPAEIQVFLRRHLGRGGPKTAQKLYQWAHQAVLPPPPIAALLAEHLQRDFTWFLELEGRFNQLAAQAEALVPASPAAVLTTVPGISPLLAARYLAHLGHAQRFTQAKEIWAFAGFDLVTEQSGDFRRLGKLTKKGEAGLRDTLYLIGFHTAQQIPALGRTKQRALARGKSDVEATLHAAHKANRLCHHLLYHQLPFDPDRVR